VDNVRTLVVYYFVSVCTWALVSVCAIVFWIWKGGCIVSTVAKPARDERLDVRLPSDLKRQLEQAAALLGQSVSAFVLGLVVPKAQQIIQEASIVELSDRDSRRFFAALDDDRAEPNDAMRRAADRYKTSVG
jgi:uncharacterized protein (DUF1778 family)